MRLKDLNPNYKKNKISLYFSTCICRYAENPIEYEKKANLFQSKSINNNNPFAIFHLTFACFFSHWYLSMIKKKFEMDHSNHYHYRHHFIFFCWFNLEKQSGENKIIIIIMIINLKTHDWLELENKNWI